MDPLSLRILALLDRYIKQYLADADDLSVRDDVDRFCILVQARAAVLQTEGDPR